MADRGSKFFGRIADWFIPGNAYNSTTSRWNPATAKVGIAGLVADQFIPGGSNIVGMAGRSGLFGSDFAGALKNEGIYNTMADQYGDFRADLRGQYLSPTVNAGDGYSPGGGIGPQGVSMGGNSPAIPTTAPVNVQGPWAGLGTSTGNVFAGGSLGNWASGGGSRGGGLSFGGGSGGYNNGSGAGTGFGATNYTNDAWGQTAAGFGVGAGNSGVAQRQTGTDSRGGYLEF